MKYKNENLHSKFGLVIAEQLLSEARNLHFVGLKSFGYSFYFKSHVSIMVE